MTAFRCVLGVWFVLGLSLCIQAAETKIQVNEAGSKATTHSQFIHLELNVENPGYREIPVRVKAILFEIQAETEVTQILPPGQSWVTLDLPLSGDLGSNQNLEHLLMYRIHYRVTPTADTGEDIATSGIFSVSLVARDVFRLRVLPQFRVTAWSEFCPKILAVHPISLTPVPQVRIKAEILSGTEVISKSILITNQDGLVEPKFQFPAGFEKITEATLRISGKAGSTFTTRDFRVQIEQSPLILVTTDKLTYTAGESLEINWFVARTDCTVVAGQKWQIECWNNRGQAIFSTTITASETGRGNLSWRLPKDLPPGMHRVKMVSLDRPDTLKVETSVDIWTSPRPKFSVQIQPEQDFYLSDDPTATITLQAQTDTGQPVAGGDVLIGWQFSTNQDQWNYTLQAWIGKPLQFVKAQTDMQGKCRVQLPISPIEAASNQLIACVTDPKTHQVASHRFQLPIQNRKQLIQIKILGHQLDNITGQPLDFIIFTSDQNGTPVQCQVDIFLNLQVRHQNQFERHFLTVHTNQFGLSCVKSLPPEMPSRDVKLTFKAHDAESRGGFTEMTFIYPEVPIVRITTDRSLYSTGQPLEITLRSNQAQLPCWVTIASSEKVLFMQLVQISQGVATLTVPYTSDLAGEVVIIADYLSTYEDRYIFNSFSYLNGWLNEKFSNTQAVNSIWQNYRAVMYQTDQPPLYSLSAQGSHSKPDPPKLVFSKGSEQTIDQGFEITIHPDRLRPSLENQLGERYTQHWQPFPERPGHELKQIGDWTRQDLANLQSATLISSEMDQLAAALLSFHRSKIYSTQSSYSHSPQITDELYRSSSSQFQSFFQQFNDCCTVTALGPFPRNKAGFEKLVQEGKLDLKPYVDPWGNPFHFEFTQTPTSTQFQILSAGPDEQFQTGDDLTFHQNEWLTLDQPLQDKLNSIFTIEASNRKVFLIADEFRKAASRIGFDLETILDPWGTPPRVEITLTEYGSTISLVSAGPDRTFHQPQDEQPDDICLWWRETDYFLDHHAQIQLALKKFAIATGRLPLTKHEFFQAMEQGGLTADQVCDPFGHRLRVKFHTAPNEYSGNQLWVSPAQRHKPVSGQYSANTQREAIISLVSNGIDGQPDTSDDIQMFSQSLFEILRAGEWSHQHPENMKNCIYGNVLNQNGEPVPDVAITAVSPQDGTIETRSDAEGRYVLPVQAPGSYQMAFFHPGTRFRFNQTVNLTQSLIKFLQVEFPPPVHRQSRRRAPTGSTAPLSGVFTDHSTGLPLANVQIEARYFENDLCFVTQTSQTGHFMLHRLPAGFFELGAKKDGFDSFGLDYVGVQTVEPVRLNEALSPVRPKPSVPASSQIQALIQKRGGSGKLVGIVKDDSGRFVSDALIQATEVHSQFVFTTTTDSTGKYQLHPLPAGEYSVEISATPPQNKPPESNSKSRYYLEQRYTTLDVIEVPIKPHQPTRLDSELTQYTAGICNDRTDVSPRQPEPPTCVWTKPVKLAPDGSLTFPERQATSNQNWTRIILLQLKDGSVRWVLR